MKKTILLLLIFMGLSSCAQELTCKDFREGTFIVPRELKHDIPYKIVRKGNTQTEIVSDPEFKQTSYIILEWIDDCSYKSTYDVKKMELTDYQKFINENGGILTELIKINGKCFHFKSTLTVDGKTERIDGKLCKE